MAKITITIEGESEEVRQALLGILGSQPQMAITQSQAALDELSTSQQADKGPLKWTPELFKEFWSGLNRNAKRILVEIAHHPEGTRIDDVKERLGIERGRIAGQLAPVGFAMRRLDKRHGKRPEPKPYETDYSAWVYRMDLDFARMVLNSVERNDS